MNNLIQHLQQAIADYELVNQRKPTRLIVDWRTRADLAMMDALPDMQIENSTAPFSVLRAE
jgi:hypothetical protein